jgi:hypothetical protein
MKPADAIRRAGSQALLHAIFEKAGHTLSKQAISLWAVKGEIPPKRELQLRRMRPWWFKRRVNGMVKQYPKPKRPPANLDQTRARQGKPPKKGGRAGKKQIKGPPFLPHTPSETEL